MRAIITFPPKSAVCSKLSPITLARPNLLLSCGTSHKVSSQSGSTYFTDSTTQKYSRNQNVETLYLWDVDGVRPETSVCLRVTVAEANFPDNQNCPSRPCPQAESLWDITSLMQSTQDQRAPIMTQTHPHHFEIPQKKILMSYFLNWLLFNSRPNFCWPPQIPIGKMQNAYHDEPDCGLHV